MDALLESLKKHGFIDIENLRQEQPAGGSNRAIVVEEELGSSGNDSEQDMSVMSVRELGKLFIGSKAVQKH
jgi:hypothetical protein